MDKAASGPRADIGAIADRVLGGGRIDADDARRLFAHPNLAELGMLADAVRRATQ